MLRSYLLLLWMLPLLGLACSETSQSGTTVLPPGAAEADGASGTEDASVPGDDVGTPGDAVASLDGLGPGGEDSTGTAADDTATPDTATPDTATPDTATPDTAGPDTATPDTSGGGPARVDLLHLGMQAHDATGYTGTLELTLPEDAVSFEITTVGEPGRTYVVDGLQSPSGKYLVHEGWFKSAQNPGGSQLCLICPIRVSAMETAGGVLVPNAPDVAVEAGTYTFRVFAFHTAQAGPFSPPTVVPDAGEVAIHIAIKRHPGGPATSGRLNLNLFFTGSSSLTAASAPTSPRVQDALAHFDAIYAQAGVSIGTVTYSDIDPAFLVVDGIAGAGNDFEEVAALTADAPPGVNLIFVKSIVDSASGIGGFGVILGVAGGIPGPAGVQGTRRSAVIVATEKPQGIPSDPMPSTMAHEVGHYLGLFHSSEFGFGLNQLHDPIPDTPWNDATNLMYYDGSQDGTTLTPGQAGVILANPWIGDEEGNR